jgi:uncharacterized membrane protein YeiH
MATTPTTITPFYSFCMAMIVILILSISHNATAQQSTTYLDDASHQFWHDDSTLSAITIRFSQAQWDLLLLTNIAATIAFAISGALVAARHRLDIVGFIFMACITGIGGGTLRDTILDLPVFWLNDYYIILVCSGAAILTFFTAQHISKRSKALLWADALGMALFTVLGAQKAISLGIDIPVAIIMGIFSACLGGIIRDVIVNDVPVVFQRDIYITASLLGAMSYCLLFTYTPLSEGYALVIGGALTFIIRALAITRKLSIPAHKGLDSAGQ